MADNISPIVFTATHLASAICASSVRTTDFKPDGLKRTAKDAVQIYLAVREELLEQAQKNSA